MSVAWRSRAEAGIHPPQVSANRRYMLKCLTIFNQRDTSSFRGVWSHLNKRFLRCPTLFFTLPINLLSRCFSLQACMEISQGEIQENRGRDGREEETSLAEKQFLKELYTFMRRRDTPIERIPNLGFKQSKYDPSDYNPPAHPLPPPVTILENVASFCQYFLIADLKKKNTVIFTISEWREVIVIFFPLMSPDCNFILFFS